MARFYANENFPYAVVRQLRSLGHDVLTVAEAGNAGQRISDEAVLAYATQPERAVLTINRRDFVRLHRQGVNHAGIIACTQDADVLGQAQRIRSVCARVYQPGCVDGAIPVAALDDAWRSWGGGDSHRRR